MCMGFQSLYQEMSTEEHDHSPPHESNQHDESSIEAFQRLYNEYMEIVSEQSPIFMEEKQMIEDSFSQQLKIIDNFRKSKEEIVLRDAWFLQQSMEASRHGL